MKKVLILLLVILSLGAFFFLKDSSDSPSEVMHEEDHSSHDHSHQHAEVKEKAEAKAKKGKAKPQKVNEPSFDFADKDEESFYQVQEKIAEVYNKKNSEKELIKFFNDQGLEPQVSRQDDPYTGSMIMIRTKKALPGTRYYHAQYFTDEAGNTFLQHMSMEFRPGPGALDRARAMIEKTFGVSGGEVARNGNFVKYNPGDGRIIWLKRMEEKDLENEVYNAYDKSKDIGTIQAAVELEIHEGGHDDHIHPDD